MLNFKSYKSGTHRSATPLETFERIKKFFPVMGITRLSNITGLDNIGIPVIAAIRPNSRSLASSQGKGLTVEAAKVSAAMESIENYHAENIYKEALNISYEDIIYRENVADITGLARIYSAPFNEAEKILWLKGKDLLNDREIWVPYNSVSTDFTTAYRPASLISDSNGLSSGNTHIESILHGLYEVIERDALSLYFHAPARYADKKIDPKTIVDVNNAKLLELISKAGVIYGMWDITTDIGIPTYICKLIDDGEYWEISARATYGSGTHLDRNVALSRAITEAIQSRATFIAGARDDQPKGNYTASYSEQALQQWRKDIKGPSNFRFDTRNTVVNEIFEEDLSYILGRLETSGLSQVACIDLTKDEFGIPVSKIIVPHLEGITHSHDRVAGNRINRLMQNDSR